MNVFRTRRSQHDELVQILKMESGGSIQLLIEALEKIVDREGSGAPIDSADLIAEIKSLRAKSKAKAASHARRGKKVATKLVPSVAGA